MAAVTSPYLTAFGRGTALSIEAFSVVRYGNCLTRSASVYSFDSVGAWEVASRLDRSLSSLVKNLMKSSAEALFLANCEMAKLCPPRLDEPGPVTPGSGATSNFPTICEDPTFCWALA